MKWQGGWTNGRKQWARIFHESIWAQLQGAGHEAVVNLLRVSCNKAAALKATRPKGEFFEIKMVKNP